MTKVTIAGAGAIGSTAAVVLGSMDTSAEIVLVNQSPRKAAGLALDLNHLAAALETSSRFVGSSENYAETAGSDVLVLAAGRGLQLRTSSLMELMLPAAVALEQLVPPLVELSPDAVVICASGPGVLTEICWELSGLPEERVFGSHGLLVTSRLKTHLAWSLGVDHRDVSGLYAFGLEHRYAVPMSLPGKIQSSGVAVSSRPDELAQAFDDVLAGQTSIMEGTSRRPHHAAGGAIAVLVRAVVDDSKQLYPVVARVHGCYDLDSVYIGTLARIGRSGVAEIIEIDATNGERAALHAAATKQRVLLSALKSALAYR